MQPRGKALASRYVGLARMQPSGMHVTFDLTQVQWVSTSSCCSHALKIHYTHISVRQLFPGHIPEVPPVEPGET